MAKSSGGIVASEIISQGGNDSQKSYVMTPVPGFDVHVSLERALEPMIVKLDGKAGMWENPMGPKTSREYDG